MDFASLMSAEIAKAKPPPPPLKTAAAKPTTTTTKITSTTTSSSSPTEDTASTQQQQQQQQQTKKYVRRSEAEAAREAAYRAEQAALEEKRAWRAVEKRKREEEALQESRAREEKRRRLEEETRRRREEAAAAEERRRRRRLGLPEVPPTAAAAGTTSTSRARSGEPHASSDNEGGGGDDVPDEELVRRLRDLGEPAVLFAESHRGRLRRYRRLTGTKTTAPAAAKKAVMTSGPIPTTLRLLDEADMKVDGTVPQSREGRQYLFRQLASYFTMVLREWEAALAREQQLEREQQQQHSQSESHPQHQHQHQHQHQQPQSFARKAAVNAMTSSRDHMRPLFRRFEKGDLEDDVLAPVVEIVRAAQERRYVDANDGYLRLSIGTAAWPIGVTMVGIHERSAREKLHAGGSGRSHIMGDEVTRKYLQAIKRCLTFAQVRWPPEDIRQLMG